MPGRPGATPVAASTMRAGQIPGDVIPAGAAAIPARGVRAVTDGIRDPPPGAAAIRKPVRRRAGCPAQPGESRAPRTQPTGPRAPGTQPTRTRAAATQPRGTRDGAARGPGGPRDSRGRRNSPQSRNPGRLRRWGALQGGLGVCIIVASAAIGAIVTIVTRSTPGFLLGLLVVVGTVTAALAIRPRTGRMIVPVPVLSYLVAALISGIVFDRSADSSKTALAIGAAQWIADGFFAMVLATALAVVITVTRWLLWRRGRPATRAPGRPVPPTGPARTGSTRAGAVQAGTGQTRPGRDGTPRPPRGAWGPSAESGHPTGFAGPGSPRESGEAGGPGGSGVPGGPGGSGGPRGGPGVRNDPGSRGTRPRTGPRPGAEPYNFSSGA